MKGGWMVNRVNAETLPRGQHLMGKPGLLGQWLYSCYESAINGGGGGGDRAIGSMAIALLGISVQRRIAGLSGQCLNSCLEFSTQRGRRALLS